MVLKLATTASLGLFAVLVFYGIAFAAANKVLLCHVTGSEENPFTIISVSEHAVSAHAAHGDFELPESGDCEDEGVPDPV